MKTARFATVVAQAGKPSHRLTWSDAAKDSTLTRAAKQNRLLSVHQQMRGGKADFGRVGMEIGRNTQYYIFPRSLQRYADRRIVAINYDLAGDAVTSSALAPKTKQAPQRANKIVQFPRTKPAAAAPEKPKPAARSALPSQLTRAQIRARLFSALDRLHAKDYDGVRERLTEVLEESRDLSRPAIPPPTVSPGHRRPREATISTNRLRSVGVSPPTDANPYAPTGNPNANGNRWRLRLVNHALCP